MPPRVHSYAARPLAEALSAANSESAIICNSPTSVRRHFAEGHYKDYMAAARGAAIAAMLKATKSKNAGAAPAGAAADGAADALEADAPLVPAGWALPSGMRHVSPHHIAEDARQGMGQAAGRMLLCCTPAIDAWGQNDVAKQGFLHIRGVVPDWGLHWLGWCALVH